MERERGGWTEPNKQEDEWDRKAREREHGMDIEMERAEWMEGLKPHGV